MAMFRATRISRAFTLVEILVVVVILGILAAVVVPRFADATDDAAESTTINELLKVRRAIDVYMAKYQVPPDMQPGSTKAEWGLIISSEFLKAVPKNPWVGGSNQRALIQRNTPDVAYQTTHGWIYDPATGDFWAGGFDADDEPLPKS